GAVEVEAVDDAEARPQGGADRAGAGGGAHEGEAGELDLPRPRRRTLADDEVQPVVLERRVEDLLDGRPQAVYLVDEEHLAGVQVGEDGRQVAGPLEHRPGGGAQWRRHLAGDDVGEGRLAKPRRTEEEDVVQGLPPLARRADEDPEVVEDLLLADVLVQPPRAQRRLDPQVLGVRDAGKEMLLEGHEGILAGTPAHPGAPPPTKVQRSRGRTASR